MNAAAEQKTPWNPSRSAIKRVKQPLPYPCECNMCKSTEIRTVNNSEIYGREFGEWPWAIRCDKCGAYVGFHPFTNIPLGTLADGKLREARKHAKAKFNALWEKPGSKMTRGEAYAWLAAQLKIPVEQCHFGWFDLKQCEKAAGAIGAHHAVPLFRLLAKYGKTNR